MGKKTKVLVITHTFPTRQNPIAAIFLLNQLKELKRYCGIKVIFPYAYIPGFKLLNPYHKYSIVPEKENFGGFEVYHPKYFMIPRIFFKFRLLNIYLAVEALFSYFASKRLGERIAKDWNPDIIHIHGLLGGGLLSIHLKKEFMKPLVSTVYGEDVYRFARQIPSKYLSMMTLENLDAIICQSKALEREVEKLASLKSYVVPMGSSVKIIGNKKKLKKSLGIPLDKKVILFAGHLVERKGVEYLLKALKIVLSKEKGLVCYIIGKGPLEQKLKALASELQLDDDVVFLGQKNHEEYAKYMNACDLFVLPSLYEGLPVVLCEAIACGKPVIATNVSGSSELVTKEVGYLAKAKNPNDLAGKIMLALARKWDVKALLKKAKEFSVESSARKVFNIYKGLIKAVRVFAAK